MSIPGSAEPLLLAQQDTGYRVERSLRFNSSDSAYLSRTPASAGNRKTWTWAAWVKRSGLGVRQNIFGTADASFYNGFWAEFFSDDKLRVGDLGGSTPLDIELKTTQVFRDCSAWGHLLIAVDTTQSTAANRLSVYWNGSKITAFDTATYPTQNFDTRLNTTAAHGIGRAGSYNAQYLSGYLADIHFIDGQALDPTSFGEFDTNGVWQPIAYTGAYPGNSFHLPFSDNSTAAALGTDTSGAGNDWTVNNLSAGTGPDYTNAAGWTLGGPSATGRSVVNQSSAFDGSTSTAPTWDGPQGGAGGGTNWGEENWLQWNANGNPIPVPSGATVEIWMPESYSGGIVRYVHRVTVNGTTYTMPFNTGTGWFNVTAAAGSSITLIRRSLYSYLEGGGTNVFPPPPSGPNAIRINGTILVAPGTTDSLVDTPTSYGTDTGAGGEVRGNYCTLNPLKNGMSLSNGNLTATNSASTYSVALGTIGVSSGKWYWEVTATTASGASIGVGDGNTNTGTYLGAANNFGYNPAGTIYGPGDTQTQSGLSTYTNGDIIGVALNLDSSEVKFYKNNSLVTTVTGLSSTTWFPAVSDATSSGSNPTLDMNFGQRPFAYTAPSGFKALCDTNLPAGTIATSGSFTGNANADGPFIWLNGVPTAMTINGNSVTFSTHADKLSNGFKLRTNNNSYNLSGSNTYSVSVAGDKFKYARAQANP